MEVNWQLERAFYWAFERLFCDIKADQREAEAALLAACCGGAS